jgi:hypothetical protein
MIDMISQGESVQGIGIGATLATFLPRQESVETHIPINVNNAGYQMQMYPQNTTEMFGGPSEFSQPDSDIFKPVLELYNIRGNSSITSLDETELTWRTGSGSAFLRLPSWPNYDISNSSAPQERSQEFFVSTFSAHPDSAHLATKVKR